MLSINKNRINIIIINVYIATLLSLILIPMSKINFHYDFNVTRFIFSWLGIILYINAVICFKKVCNAWVNTLSIFITFLFLFSYGQCILWAFGIHVDGEIGTTKLFSNYIIRSSDEIIKTQIVSCLYFQYLIIGTLLFKHKKKRVHNIQKIQKIIYKVSVYLSAVVIPLTLLYIIYTIQYSAQYGYTALYYSDFSTEKFTSIMRLVEIYFFPCLVGILIGSNYGQKQRKIVYFILLCYSLLYLIAGERGNWIYKVIIIFWLEFKYHRKFDILKFIKYMILGTVSLYLVSIVVNIRGVGLSNISLVDIVSSFDISKFPIFTFISEMGGTMGVFLIVLCSNFSWNYSNSYLTAILGIPTTKIPSLLGLDIVLASNVLSNDFLQISWGTGFSMFSEAYMNFGFFGGGICCLIIGLFISSILYLPDQYNIQSQPLAIFFAITSLDIFCGWSRSIALTPLRNWFRGPCLLILLFYLLYKIKYKER